ncbi:uncharacterized protein NECHADRAFT_76708 [Fusarium vanettenii 77-13-4]|uniref:Uncharacterized protein n=1 Tax=Fusarium vanettenii (strain ATCC MYA-4622 / CBS 123669 / FGSC 9596 / NRRL 45880 / 77-13-4) TaxID=660122 RepID=C7Z510_FUSV7|nr:uncharacterized protein NECHADRAFT_76708 [Fusarium vanettenii 77-13-4]EEU40438.1 predicted protein [Fusarium vanettenii 77-13-4]
MNGINEICQGKLFCLYGGVASMDLLDNECQLLAVPDSVNTDSWKITQNRRSRISLTSLLQQANAPQESRPGSPSNRPCPRPRPRPQNPPPPAYALPIRAAVPPVVPCEARAAQPRTKDATQRDRREAAIRSAQEAEQAALEELEREDEELRARGIQGWSRTKRGPNGELLVRSQQLFGLEIGSEGPSEIRICITRVKNGKRESKTIALNDLPEPTQPPDDQDTRNIEMLNDVFSASAPHTDTIRIFPNAIGMWCRGENKQWRPEHIFPEKKEKRGDVIAPMSVSEEFLVPGEQTDVRSLTSNGHFIHHHPPPGIGLSWGDWDLYTEWQAHGRSVDKNWVPRGDWKPKVEGEIVFVADNEDPSGEEIIVDRVPVRPDYRATQRNIEGPTSSEGEPRDGHEEARQLEEVVEGKEVKEVEAKEVGVEVAQTRSIEAGAKEEEINVGVIEEEEVEDEETFIKLPHGR